MIEEMLEFVQDEAPYIAETILMNSNHDDPNWNPAMETVSEIVAEEFGFDSFDPEFHGLWDAVCEIVRREALA